MTLQDQLAALLALQFTLLASDVSTDEQDEALALAIERLEALLRRAE